MNKPGLISTLTEALVAQRAAVAAENGTDAVKTTKKEVEALYEVFTNTYEGLVLAGEAKIPFGGLGNFKVETTNERNARNPQTGEAIVVPAHPKAKFAVSKSIKDALKEG